MASPEMIIIGKISPQCFSMFIIAKLYKPCKTTARKNPLIRRTFRFLVSKKLKAKKNPNVPEQRACRKVAEMNLKPAKARVSPKFKRKVLGDKKINRFSRKTKPRAEIII
jgi:hypothetical protein